MSELQLYWVTTEDHDEDWFVVAANPHEAARCFEQNIGYDRGDATANKVLDVPPDMTIDPADPDWFERWPGWPSDDGLITLGARFISHDSPRVVVIAGQTYAEGTMEGQLRALDDDAFELLGKGRPNGTYPGSGSSQ
jgi:hypothetical protein